MSRPSGTKKEEMSRRSFEETTKLYADGIKSYMELASELIDQHIDNYDRPPLGILTVRELIAKALHDAKVIINQ